MVATAIWIGLSQSNVALYLTLFVAVGVLRYSLRFGILFTLTVTLITSEVGF